jgi:hypothetical protein
VARKVPRGRRERWYSSTCPPSIRVLPPFMSIDEAAPVFLYLLGDFLTFVGAVHSASPPPPSLCVLPPFMSSFPPFMYFLPSCPAMRQSLFFSTYSVISLPLLGLSIVPLPLLPPFVFFLPSCHPFLPSCPSSLHVLPPFMSFLP